MKAGRGIVGAPRVPGNRRRKARSQAAAAADATAGHHSSRALISPRRCARTPHAPPPNCTIHSAPILYTPTASHGYCAINYSSKIIQLVRSSRLFALATKKLLSFCVLAFPATRVSQETRDVVREKKKRRKRAGFTTLRRRRRPGLCRPCRPSRTSWRSWP